MPYCHQAGLPLCNKTGIYSITCLVTGKVYIGSALCIRARLFVHRSELDKNKHCNARLQNAWNKYGRSQFYFNVVKVCDPDVLVELEQYWIDYLQTRDDRYGFNMQDAGPCGRRGLKLSDDARFLMSIQRKGKAPVEATLAAAIANRGKKRQPFSEETKQKMREIALRNGQDPAHRAKRRASHWMTKLSPEERTKRASMAAQHRKYKHLSDE